MTLTKKSNNDNKSDKQKKIDLRLSLIEKDNNNNNDDSNIWKCV